MTRPQAERSPGWRGDRPRSHGDRMDCHANHIPACLAGGASHLARLASRLHGASPDPRADRRPLGSCDQAQLVAGMITLLLLLPALIPLINVLPVLYSWLR